MKIPTLTSKKHKILTHNNIDYYLFYHPVLNCIKNILSISDISQNFTLRFENFKYKGEKAYSEQYTGNWWKNTEASLPHGSNLLSIILYSDATTTDTLGKSSLHPIYISIGNISTKRRNKSDAKQLLGYLPILKAKDKSEKKSKDFKKLVRLTFHNSMKFLLDPLFAEKGIDLEVDNKTFWFFSRISTIICDWPEAATFSLVYKSTNSNFPCHFCLISKTLLADTDLSDVTFRNNENMQEYFYNNAGQDVSLENIPNYFWSLPSINVYSATVPDRMHHLDLGLFHYQIEFTQALLQKQDSSLVNKIDNRLSKIPRFQKFQMFTNGLQSISRMTAKEYRILMKVMVFVVDNLYKENENNVENFVENKKLSEVYAKWNKMYMMSRSEIFTESDLENFRKDTFEWAKLFVEIFKPYSRSKLKFSKFHSWIYHIFESIRQFGIINGYTTETYESLHKDFVKIPYRMSNKKNVEDQIMKTLKRQDIINVINKKQKKKKPTKLLNFSSKLFETKLTEANIYFCEKMNDPNINDNMIKDEGEGENEDEDNDSYNAEVEEESLTSDISHSSVSFFENMELSNSEPENYSFNNYASDYNNICEKAEPIEFPNNAYANLIALVTNYNLSNEAINAVICFFNEHSNLPLSPLPKNAKKGRKLMKKMKIPTLTSKKHKILTHNNIDYYLFYHPVLNCIKNILSISDISQNFTLRFENFKYKGEKAYSEQYTGNWWKNTEASLPHSSNLLSIILYSDATTTDTLAKDKSEKKSKDFKKLVRLTFHNSMKFLLDPLFAEKGIDLEVDNKTFWFFPRISTIIYDWPEAATFSLVYKSTNSNFSCHFCLISKTLLADTVLSDVTFRNNENMQEYFYNNAGQDVSLENIPNYFWSLPSINVYSATVPDRMHHLDLGLFHYQIEFTQALLQKQDSSLVNKIDNRLSKIPRFQKFQMFTNGLQSISRMTAKEYRILMKVMVFVVDNLYKENENNVENFVENKKLSEVYAKWNKMYMMSRSEIFTESDLENFRKDTFEWAKLFVEIFKPYSRSKLKFPKFHSWIYHIFESIRQFGIINGYTTETYESLHKDFQ
ncbi:hypothetical protein Glove_22g136 [Diversispora epigaea]|uniref:Uncharacterized protein n=1 Tax=Diversispora epigaea TaxID=1348612 RepID=A0A397JLI1_9GLOM|nr:hypothetical protein Glove_22g136 [Diversispora epigaea]